LRLHQKGLGLGQPATTRESSAPAEVRSIQYLRGLAAFGVLIFHAAERAGGAFGVGAAGVDVFFVISGFIMWVVTCNRTPSPGQFLWKRVQRIVPLYWAVTLVTAAVAVLIPGAFPTMQVTLEAVLKSLLFVPHRDPHGLIAPLIVPGWTLNYEMFFYLIFAAGLLAPTRLRPWLVSAALLALVAVRPLLDGQNPLVATYTDPILLEFAAGIWLGKAWSERRLPGATFGWAFVAMGLALFAGVAVAGLDVSQARVLLWGVPAFLLVAGAVSVERAGPVPSLPPLRILGDASYSLYLVHGLAISAALRALKIVGVTAPGIVFATAIVAGVIAGLIAYHLIERPAMKLFRTGFARAPGLTAASAP
jgi:exopolysaccharide production protein ExoZ